MSSAITTRLYGNYLSQPSRAILWAAAMKGLPMEMKKINPIVGEAETPEFLAKFPSGFIPALEIIDTTTNAPILHLTEGPAILSYLAETHGWNDLYPTASSSSSAAALSIAKRAEIQQWMHWAQNNLRPIATTQQFRPLMLKKMQAMGLLGDKSSSTPSAFFPEGGGSSKYKFPLSKEQLAEKKALAAAANEAAWRDAMLTMTHGALKKRTFLASTESEGPTIADLSLYCEIDQLYYVGKQLFALQQKEGEKGDAVSPILDFSRWPEVLAWIQRMEAVPEHDNVRRTMFKFLSL